MKGPFGIINTNNKEDARKDKNELDILADKMTELKRVSCNANMYAILKLKVREVDNVIKKLDEAIVLMYETGLYEKI